MRTCHSFFLLTFLTTLLYVEAAPGNAVSRIKNKNKKNARPVSSTRTMMSFTSSVSLASIISLPTPSITHDFGLPPEIDQEIAKKLPIQDMENLRLVCCKFGMNRDMYKDLKKKQQQNFVSIPAHLPSDQIIQRMQARKPLVGLKVANFSAVFGRTIHPLMREESLDPNHHNIIPLHRVPLNHLEILDLSSASDMQGINLWEILGPHFLRPFRDEMVSLKEFRIAHVDGITFQVSRSSRYYSTHYSPWKSVEKMDTSGITLTPTQFQGLMEGIEFFMPNLKSLCISSIDQNQRQQLLRIRPGLTIMNT